MSASPRQPAAPPRAVLAAYGLLDAGLERVTSGLVNATWIATRAHAEPRVLQWVHPVFNPETQHDIEVVTRHLDAKGIETPLLVATGDGRLFVEADAGVWRVMTYIDGRTVEAIARPAEAREAGRVLAAFHGALGDLDHALRGARGNIHHLDRHLERLRAALDEHVAHRHRRQIARLAGEILALARRIPEAAPTPDRLVHGDPKISNVVFARGGDEAICLIDLDTISRMPIASELGDAFRSWCNPGAEDAGAVEFDAGLFAAACDGYAAGAPAFLDAAEWRQLPAATARIALELAARFCADALKEAYFAWDAARYESASAHNQARAGCQTELARQVLERGTELGKIVEGAFGAPGP